MLPWLEYTGQAPTELVAQAEANRVDSIVEAFATALFEKETRLGRDFFSKVELYIYAINWLEREVNNGGFTQFFSNSSHVFTPVIVQALLTAGLPKTAMITQSAIDALELPDNYDFAEIVSAALADDEDRQFLLNELDIRFLEYEEDLSGVLFEYIQAHINQIQF